MKARKLLIALAAVLMAASCEDISVSLDRDIPWWIEIVGKTYTCTDALDYWGDTFDFTVKVAGSNASPDSLCFVLDLDAKLYGKNYSAVNKFNTFEGLFDKDNYMITIPKGQAFSRREGYLEGYVLNGWNNADPHIATSADEDILISVKPDCSEITILNAFGTQKQGTTNWTTIYCGNLTLTAQ